MDLPALRYFGEWNKVFLRDCLHWYHPRVNRRLNELFGDEKIGVFFIREAKQYLFLAASYLAQLERTIDSVPQATLLAQFQAYYAEFDAVEGALMAKMGLSAVDLSDEELAGEFDAVFRLMNRTAPFDQHCMVGEQFYLAELERYLKRQLEAIGEPERFNEYRALLTSPTRLTSTQLEEASLLRLAIAQQQGADSDILERGIAEHLRQFGWLPVFLVGDPWDESYVRQQLASLANEADLSTRLEKILAHADETKRRVDALLRRFPEQSLWPALMQEVAFQRNESETMISLGNFVLKPVYAEISKRTGLTLTELRYLTPEEIVEAIREKTVDRKELLRRQACAFGLTDEEQTLLRSGDEAERLFQSLYKRPRKENATTLKGSCASVGTARGTVRIIKGVADMARFRKGDILVSESTCIDYVPIMRLAGAVVTEMGGITSHAAIVSRELSIPCVVGVPNVHLTLKEGQEIEVDAEKGTITLLP